MTAASDDRFEVVDCPEDGQPIIREKRPAAAYRRRPWWRRYTIQSYRVWKLAYRLGLTKEPW